MICFEVSLNGKRLARAGIPGYAVVSTIIGWVKSKNRAASPGKPHYESLYLNVGGLDSNQEPGVYVDWVGGHDLSVGDEVKVRVVDEESADPPRVRRSRQPTKAQRAKQLRAHIAELTKELRTLDGNGRSGGRAKKSRSSASRPTAARSRARKR